MDAADGELRELVFARLAERDLAQAVAELVATRSENPPGHEDAVAAALAGLAARWGLAARVERVADGPQQRPRHDGRPAADGPDVLMVGHLDTVPADPAGWTVDPFAGRSSTGACGAAAAST
jgi:acetylornithine deacetylase/succinyl-diaminopimelate desuccinylase-like protein